MFLSHKIESGQFEYGMARCNRKKVGSPSPFICWPMPPLVKISRGNHRGAEPRLRQLWPRSFFSNLRWKRPGKTVGVDRGPEKPQEGVDEYNSSSCSFQKSHFFFLPFVLSRDYRTCYIGPSVGPLVSRLVGWLVCWLVHFWVGGSGGGEGGGENPLCESIGDRPLLGPLPCFLSFSLSFILSFFLSFILSFFFSFFLSFSLSFQRKFRYKLEIS